MKTKRFAVCGVVGVAMVAALIGALPALAAHHGHGQRRAGEGGASAPFTVEELSPAATAELARTGQVTLPVAFGGPGTVVATGDAATGTVTVSADVTGPEGHSQKIEVPAEYVAAIRPTSVTVTRARTADLTLSLTAWAKSELAAGHPVEVILSLAPAGGATGTVPALGMFIGLHGS
jgi:hypothetical protein